MHKTTMVEGWTEHGDGVVWGTGGFEALIGLHAIIEGRREAVNAHIGVFDERWHCPFAVLRRPGAFDVAISHVRHGQV